MKLKDLIPKLQALNPEAEVYVAVDSGDLVPLRGIHPGSVGAFGWEYSSEYDAMPTDTLIVLSE